MIKEHVTTSPGQHHLRMAGFKFKVMYIYVYACDSTVFVHFNRTFCCINLECCFMICIYTKSIQALHQRHIKCLCIN